MPELAPGSSLMEVSSELARATLSHIAQDFLAENSLEDLAHKLGVTDRHIRKVFRDEFGVSPVEYLQTQRLLLAKQLLTDTRLPIISVAMASGFKSLRRFNFALKERYRMTPTEFRKTRNGAEKSSGASFRLAYRPPFDWERLLGFLSRRAIPGVEAIENGVYFRTVRVNRQKREFAGFIAVGHDREAGMISVRLSDELVPVCAVILDRVRRFFDLRADPGAINAALGRLAEARPGLRVPGCFDGYEMAIRAILGQQVSVAGASTLAGRFVARFGTPIAVPASKLSHLFPLPSRMGGVSAGEISRLGITGQRAQTIVAVTQAINTGDLVLEPGHGVEETLRKLRLIPGVGEWTAEYLAMRALSWPDAFPHADLGIAKALGETNPKRILEMTEKWRPWRAYAALHLWSSLENKP
jgi:AraC family transcriptional regulator, regulatory protein of adaptative response / DNA-3-methyladenine glycosylase II